MQWNSWGDGQAETVADIHFTYNRHAIRITRCGTIHANCQPGMLPFIDVEI